ncbi:MAG: ATP-binding protein [Veillonellaceae bacterium]|nr:ATP-binding protein [Veillonellaceae bacterium]
MKLIARPEYMKWLENFKDTQLIKVITGIRRCGKSTVMKLFQDELIRSGVKAEQIVTVNLEDFDSYDLWAPEKLYAYIKERLQLGRMTYIFIDEIQHCQDFPRLIDSLYIKENVDLYITGSNAYFLSSEIATLLTGRYVEIRMLPLSFKEYVEGLGYKRTEYASAYRRYLQESSFPYALALRDKPQALDTYLEGLFNTIIVKDISQRYSFRNLMMLESIARFIFSAIGNPLSIKKIADTMVSNGRKIEVPTVERYVKALIDSFIIYPVRRYDLQGKQYLRTLEKYYVVDPGMRYWLLGRASQDVGHVLENVIYLELVRRGYTVSVGKIGNLEVDFIARDSRGLIYIQVAATVRDEHTLQRELRPLEQIDDNYPKFILTLDEDPEGDYKGIRRINALDWLMGESV